MLIKTTSSVQISTFPHSNIFYVKPNFSEIMIEKNETKNIPLDIRIDENFIKNNFTNVKMSKLSIFFSIPMEYKLKGLSIEKNPLPYPLNAISIELKNYGHDKIIINDDFICGIGITYALF